MLKEMASVKPSGNEWYLDLLPFFCASIEPNLFTLSYNLPWYS
jgi:hypothetical protein